MSPQRAALRQQIAEAHGFALFKHYSERDAAGFLGLAIHPVTLKKLRRAGTIALGISPELHAREGRAGGHRVW